MPDKQAWSYKLILSTLKEAATARGFTFEPKEILVDYEIAMISAIDEIFETTKVRECFFHFCLCIYRNVNKNGLSNLYDQIDEVFKILVRKIMALAFLPVDIICEEYRTIFDEIKEKYIDNDSVHRVNVIKFLNYVTLTWMNDNATFKKDLWNQYKKRIRTTNNAEGFNRGFNNHLHQAHPNIHQLIKLLKDEEMNTQINYNKFDGKNKFDKHKVKKYVDMQKQIDFYYRCLEQPDDHPDKIDAQRFLYLTQFLLVDK